MNRFFGETEVKRKSSKHNSSSLPSNCTSCVQEPEKLQKTSGGLVRSLTIKISNYISLKILSRIKFT